MRLTQIREDFDEYEGLDDTDEFGDDVEYFINDAEGNHEVPVYDDNDEYIGEISVLVTNIDAVGAEHHWKMVSWGGDVEIDGVMTVYLDLDNGGWEGYEWKGSPDMTLPEKRFPSSYAGLNDDLLSELINLLVVAYPVR